MALTPPIADDAATPEQRAALDRIRAAVDAEPAVEFRMMARSPRLTADAFALQRAHLKADDGVLDLKTREAIALATSAAHGCKDCVKAHARACRAAGWSEEAVTVLLGIAAECAMLNAYHRHRHLDPGLQLPAESSLTHTLLEHPPIDAKVVELLCVVISGLNACPRCVEHHTTKARTLGVTDGQLREAVRVAAAMTLFNLYFRAQ